MSTNLEISNYPEGDVLVLSLRGRLDTVTSPEAETAVQACITGGAKNIVLDAAHLQYVSSAGLRILLAAKKRLIPDGGDIRLAALIPQVRSVFTIAGFDRIFPMYDDVQSAVKSFR